MRWEWAEPALEQTLSVLPCISSCECCKIAGDRDHQPVAERLCHTLAYRPKCLFIPAKAGFFMPSPMVKRCSFTGCRVHVPINVRFCVTHRRQANQTYGSRHRAARRQVFEQAGWRCHYCGGAVDLADDVCHVAPTRLMSAAEAERAPKVPAHRECHNRHAPHLMGAA